MIQFLSWTRRQMAGGMAVLALGCPRRARGHPRVRGPHRNVVHGKRTAGRPPVRPGGEVRALAAAARQPSQAKDVVVELIDFNGDERTALQLRRFVRDLVQDT